MKKDIKDKLEKVDERITRLEKMVFGFDIVHWTKRYGCNYDDPVENEPKECPKCNSKNIGRTAEVCSIWRSPLMCRDCYNVFGGNVPNLFGN